ncbi:MAG: IS630 family transposase [Chloroflexi bacterium]|nr:IS630 family transposase [Chloroflexota bacterium]
MTRRRGRAPRGARVIGAVPRNHGANLTCLMAIAPAGVLEPCVFEGAVDGPLFQQWLTTWLLPKLPAGTTIVLDNLSVHRSPAVRKAVTAAHCHLRYLPSYSPDFNPIEQIFAKLKTHLRGAAARTPDTLITAIGEGLNRVTAQDIAGCYRHCGFPLPESEGQHS